MLCPLPKVPGHVTALLLAFLVVGPGLAAAQTAPGAAGPASNGSAGFSRLSVRLYGGLSTVAADDVNLGSALYFDVMTLYQSMMPDRVTTNGGFGPVHRGGDVGVDLIFQISRRLGLGVGLGSLRCASSSQMSLVLDDVDVMRATSQATLSAVPVSAGAFLTLPLGPSLALTADVRAIAFARRRFELTQNLVDISADDWQGETIEGTESGFAADLGVQAALGLEVGISRRAGFFIEAAGRSAKLGNFSTAVRSATDDSGSSGPTAGTLYLVQVTEEGRIFNTFAVSETPPPAEPPVISSREPIFDFSGLSLRAGIRIRL